jgi:signal peptidase II
MYPRSRWISDRFLLRRMKKKTLSAVLGILFFLILIWADRITKNLAVLHLKDQPEMPLIRGIFVLQYLENRGAAFGILQGRRLPLILITIIILAVVLYVYARAPYTRKFIFLRVILVLVGAGAVGNFVDRISNGYVVDFLYFKAINFPIFNVADIYVVAAAVLLIYAVLFLFQEEDFAALKDRLVPHRSRHSEKNHE